MTIYLFIILLVSNAVASTQDKSILFFRIVIKTLLFASLISFNNLFTQPLEKGIGIYNGLFNITTFTQTFNNEICAVGVRFNPSSITINSALSSIISVLILLLILFIYITGEWFNIVSILTLILFKA